MRAERILRRGWCLGDDQFRKELLAVGKSAGGSHYGSERQERDQEKANRLVDEDLRRLGWAEKELEQRPKGDIAEVIESYPQDKYSPSGLLLGFTRAGRALHFQVSFAESDTTRIITIYEPDPNEWIENRKRR